MKSPLSPESDQSLGSDLVVDVSILRKYALHPEEYSRNERQRILGLIGSCAIWKNAYIQLLSSELNPRDVLKPRLKMIREQ